MSASPSAAPLFIEIGCEDLPARYVAPLADALAHGLADGLKRRHVSFAKVERFATPRRIAARLETVARSQPERLIQRDGPSLATAVKDG
ncbi:MAG TPA: glycine--tRNA ligase subunit beta, partial [Nevskiaceae bacterium]|nr:glycine--tRNA ligase subunit beta [Nevskiaceae bacterium]